MWRVQFRLHASTRLSVAVCAFYNLIRRLTAGAELSGA